MKYSSSVCAHGRSNKTMTLCYKGKQESHSLLTDVADTLQTRLRVLTGHVASFKYRICSPLIVESFEESLVGFCACNISLCLQYFLPSITFDSYLLLGHRVFTVTLRSFGYVIFQSKISIANAPDVYVPSLLLDRTAT